MTPSVQQCNSHGCVIPFPACLLPACLHPPAASLHRSFFLPFSRSPFVHTPYCCPLLVSLPPLACVPSTHPTHTKGRPHTRARALTHHPHQKHSSHPPAINLSLFVPCLASLSFAYINHLTLSTSSTPPPLAACSLAPLHLIPFHTPTPGLIPIHIHYQPPPVIHSSFHPTI